jgi:predicted dehydrogenase
VVRKIKGILDAGTIGRVSYARAFFGSYLPGWRKHGDYRKSYSAQAVLGGGVILDLSHEIDYMYWFFGMPEGVISAAGKLSDLAITSEDTAEIILRYPSLMGSIHVDYTRRVPKRGFFAQGEKGVLSADLLKNTITIIIPGKEPAVVSFGDLDRNQMYLDEAKEFIACMRGKKAPLVSLDEGIDVLAICLSAKTGLPLKRRKNSPE